MQSMILDTRRQPCVCRGAMQSINFVTQTDLRSESIALVIFS
jgi:hypothetical protein